MNVKIHRGKNQIGGNIIEIATDTTKILLDAGLELDDEKNRSLPDIEGLFDSAAYDAIFISHYHCDHMGLVYRAHKDIPIYIGEGTYNIIKAGEGYKKKTIFCPKGFLQDATPVQIGDISVTPYLCDHSAFDSYMFLCEAGGEKVLYTGDFRSNGRKSFDSLLSKLPKRVDRLLCEGTTLSRKSMEVLTENDLEESATEIFRKTKGPIFILQSAMNIDRLVTVYRAAKKSGRIFLEDVYAADIATAAGKNIPNPVFDDVFAFITSPSKYGMLLKYKHRAGKKFISQNPFVMCVRNSMLSYMKSLAKKISFRNGILVYSFWEGYREKESMQNFLKECEKAGLKIVNLHTSGHADKDTIKKLIETVNPKVIIPIHTENAKGFYELAPNAVIEE